MIPLIGVTARATASTSDSPRLIGVGEPYLKALIAAGGLPLIIPLTMDESVVRSYYDKCAGILIPGGEDVSPALYGEAPHPKLGALSPERDFVESTLVRWAYQDDLPLLGVCRGLQIINVAMGGTLYQDLDSQFNSSLDHTSSRNIAGPWAPSHLATIEPQSKLAEILGCNEMEVNSKHHQAVKQLAANLKLSAASHDGICEAFEAPTKKFFMAVQCHPEALYEDDDKRWGSLFRRLVSATAR